MIIEETVLPEIFNPAERLLKEAGARLGDPGGAREMGGSKISSALPAPTFETGVDADGNDIDLFLSQVDWTESTTELTIP